ncbi:Laccase abr2 [Pseudocercospora fuligena]|uniref:Laccase abr2 n=1 Tax=Pseudocercospora fuligena TaxID=685502 RepID=A0A8H6VPP3_9PEZI|nr:Laccase abr2 [Pseudocercospora fuligena]
MLFATSLWYFWNALLPIWSEAPVFQVDGCRPSAETPPVLFEVHLTSSSIDAIGAGAREVILVNGSFPGPTLRVSIGTEVNFLVRNYLQEDTTIHFHGIGQRKTPWADGVPGLTQRQIRPGASFMYRWTAEEAGVYFYHGHSKGQLMDGLYGSIVVDSPNADRPFNLISSNVENQKAMRAAERSVQPLLVADWSQYKFNDFYSIEAAANFDLACTDAILVNGMGSQYCLEPASLDNMTNPIILKMLQDLGEDHMTAKGCVPPIKALQGDFDVDLDRLPPEAVRKCVGGQNPAGNYTIPVDSKLGWAALTFINVGGLCPLQIALDNHEFHVFAVDGQYIQPVTTDRVLVGTGNRVSVMIKLDQEPARYALRIANDLLNQILGGFAELSYDGSKQTPRRAKPKMNYAGQPLIADMRSFKPEDSHPYPAQPPARKSDRTFKMLLGKPGRPFGSYEWSLTGHEVYNMTAEEDDPPLLFRGSPKMPDNELVIRTNIGDWIDLILETEGPFAQGHPIHKHANKLYFLGSGIGKFPWKTIAAAEEELPAGTFNFVDPPYLDTFTTPDIAGNAPAVWTAVRYKAEYPGTWLFHCHVQTHLSGGMGVVIVDGIDVLPEVPLNYREWNGFEPPLLEHAS